MQEQKIDKRENNQTTVDAVFICVCGQHKMYLRQRNVITPLTSDENFRKVSITISHPRLH
jgi:hypothetical protein